MTFGDVFDLVKAVFRQKKKPRKIEYAAKCNKLAVIINKWLNLCISVRIFFFICSTLQLPVVKIYFNGEKLKVKQK